MKGSAPMTNDEMLAARRRLIGRNVSTGYRRPVQLVRGSMQYLFDADGRRYIDGYNNVPHVGHCHPRVVDAAERQMRALTRIRGTSTRISRAMPGGSRRRCRSRCASATS